MQETGYCPYGEDCHYAHSMSELDNVDISSNLVTKALDSEGTETVTSTGSAKSMDDRNTALG